jgi:diguanylate cyclase
VIDPASGADPTPPRPSPLAGCVRELVRAAVGTGYVPMSPVEAEELIGGLISQLVDGLFAQPFRTTPGYEVGAALVEAHFIGPEMVGRMVRVLSDRLLPDLDADSPELRSRLAALLGGVATGYARALRDRVREDQEETRRAMMIAQHLAAEQVRTSEERSWWQLRHDSVTELPNRELLLERLSAALRRSPDGAPVGLCLLALERFGAINDSLGHETADDLLRAVARRLEDRFAGPGYLVARSGGDQFAVLAVGAADGEGIACAALAVLSEPFEAGPHRLPVRVSAGAADRGAGASDPAELLRRAEVTLRWAKADGGGRWLRFDADRHAEDLARWALSADLPAALERSEFVVDYQPITWLSDGAVRGVEALVRWRHPVRGLLGPDLFIGLAEETGLIVDLGRWVLAQACREAAGWPGGVAAPFVSVNLAVRQTRQPDLVAGVLAVLAETGLPASRLQLEITESAVLGPEEAPMRALRDLRAAGVRIAMDDFGTGWANYAHLRDLPVGEIKLASGFVANLAPPDAPDADTVDRQVLAGLVGLAHAVGLTVTAEGVETAAQAQRLRELGCDAGQGWYFGRPCAPGDLRF